MEEELVPHGATTTDAVAAALPHHAGEARAGPALASGDAGEDQMPQRQQQLPPVSSRAAQPRQRTPGEQQAAPTKLAAPAAGSRANAQLPAAGAAPEAARPREAVEAAPASRRAAAASRPGQLFSSPLLESAAAAYQPAGRGEKRVDGAAPPSPPPPKRMQASRAVSQCPKPRLLLLVGAGRCAAFIHVSMLTPQVSG